MAELYPLLIVLDDIPNHDDFKVVLVSSDNIPDVSPNSIVVKFDSFEDVNNYIQTIQSERTILLVLTDFFEHLSYFNNLSQIQSIYILERYPQNMTYERQNYSKLINVFINEDTLFERLHQDILLTYRNDFPITMSSLNDIKIERSLTSLNKNTFMFLWNQLFTYFLVDSSHVDMNQLKQEMIEQCRLEYKNNRAQLTHIDDFNKDCTDKNVLFWYTNDSFVYRLVNKAFRTRNIDLIRKFQYFYILLHKKLKELSFEQKNKDMKLFRCQLYNENDLRNFQLNIGHLISIDTIMSTTRDITVAKSFIAGASIEIIFEINIENATNYICHPFADTSRFSSKKDEEEILFFAGAVFRIDSVDKEDDSIWIIKLTLHNETDKQIEQLINSFTKLITSETYKDDFFMERDDIKLFNRYHTILTKRSFTWVDVLTNKINIDVDYLFSNIDDHEKLIEYYKKLLLDKNFIDQPKSIILNIIIGKNYSRLFEHKKAFDHYNEALEVLDDENCLKGEVFHHIGDLWRQMNAFDTALLCYEEALEILRKHGVKHRYVAKIYRKARDLCREQNKLEMASMYDEKLNEIDEDYWGASGRTVQNSLEYYQNQLNSNLDLSSSQRANIFHLIGISCLGKGDYSQALDNLLEAKRLLKDHLPSNKLDTHRYISLYESLAGAYFFLDKYLNALISWRKAIGLRITFLCS